MIVWTYRCVIVTWWMMARVGSVSMEVEESTCETRGMCICHPVDKCVLCNVIETVCEL